MGQTLSFFPPFHRRRHLRHRLVVYLCIALEKWREKMATKKIDWRFLSSCVSGDEYPLG